MNQESVALKDMLAADAGKIGGRITESVRLLIVDDEASMRELCRRAIADTGVTVETASSPEEALLLLRGNTFDIIITDLQMKDPRAGVTLTEEVRNHWPQTDILIMTGQPSLETAISTLKTGVADYLIKPFSMPQLQTVVSKLLGMRRLRRELESQKLLYQKLAEDYAVLQKIDRLRSALIGRVSHELRTPVTIVRLSVEAIKDEIPPSELPLYQALDSALNRMQATVEDLLLFSKTQDEDFQITKTVVDIWPILEQLLADYRPLCDERELQVKINLEGEKRALLADAELMKAVFAQLLLNAINFNHKGGSVEVLARYEPEQTVVIFTDTGEGIAPQEQSRIFEGLYQVADYMTRKVGGLGVGLAIVRRIVEAHGGSVSVKSYPGTGSAFTVLFPKQKDAAIKP